MRGGAKPRRGSPVGAVGAVAVVALVLAEMALGSGRVHVGRNGMMLRAGAGIGSRRKLEVDAADENTSRPAGVAADAHAQLCEEDAECGYPRGKCVPSVTDWNAKMCLCESPYYGEGCKSTDQQLVCVPNCLNGGVCDVVTKTCRCRKGTVGPACDKKCPAGISSTRTKAVLPCSGRGVCVDLGHKATCACPDGWSGETCSRKVCPMTSNGECDAQGECVDGKCKCFDNFAGSDCTKRTCNLDCSGHGKCDASMEICECEEGWYGKNCRYKVCPTTRFGVCSGHGSCSDDERGHCLCDEEWHGKACHLKQCALGVERKGCSGHGRCRGDTCFCKIGWGGEACQKRVCPLGCLATAGRGDCVGGKCVCAPGFTGEGCEIKETIPLGCGDRCQRECMQLRPGGDSNKHCHQVAPPQISANGTYPEPERSFDPENDVPAGAFPGFKCFQSCQMNCFRGCLAQLYPGRQISHAEKLKVASLELEGWARTTAETLQRGADRVDSRRAAEVARATSEYIERVAGEKKVLAQEALELVPLAKRSPLFKGDHILA